MRELFAYAKNLRNLLRRRGESHHDAEDLVQEAFLRLHEYLRSGEEVRQPRSFLTRTALNLAIDHGRSRDRHPTETLENVVLIDLSSSPQEEFEARQRLNDITRILDTRVSRRARNIYYLHRLEGYTHTEIAERMQLSVRTVEKEVARVLTQLWMEAKP